MSVPADSDHRADQTPVRDQGDRQTCVGFAVAAAHEWMRRDGQVQSVEDVLWAGHQVGGPQDREETSVQLALTGLQQHDHCTEQSWPYGQPPWPAPRPAGATGATLRSLPSFRQLPLDLDIWASELADAAAVVLTVGVVLRAWQEAARTGLVDAEPGRPARGNHAVLAVGFTSGSPAPRRRLIFKNSWADTWGSAGYGLLSERYLSSYAVRAHRLGDRS